ncbi:rod shape-determining protein MreD [Maritimibacter dapengensis]|uniref:Rod shape-determining protein MreD n=1 Tax=Maritimibacter dapengensis TaxID=2836868 RepID=A0ABS6T029_9RHOB|nr:rod shape-determining protein MreD [Maritimibacter dapengensis]MBV7378595.1 rod shape-determining protein MreD [Maritimibacter dapengensis]
MIDPYLLRRALYALGFVLLSAAILFVRILPIDTGPGGFPPPDLILCFAFAWSVRRPDYLPVVVVIAVLIVADMLTLSAPFLAPFLALIALETLRSRRAQLADQGFVVEWVLVGTIFTLMMLAERLILGLFLVPQPAFGLSVLETLVSAVFYPIAVLITTLGLRVTWLKPGALDPEAQVP